MKLQVTPDIQLSPLAATDADDVTEHLQDHEVSRYTLLIPHPYPLELAHEWIASHAEDVERHGHETIWAIREATGRMIGVVELAPGGHARTHCAEIGYWLAKPFWNRGIMTAVVGFVVELGFREFGLCRITAPIFVVNTGSARVLAKAGFHVEAPALRKAYQRDGQFFDARLYAILRDEPARTSLQDPKAAKSGFDRT